MNRKRIRRIAAYVLMIVMGIVFIYYGFDMARYAAASADWLSVIGTVIQSGVVADHDTTPGTDYEPRIVVEYKVDGQRYTCDRVWFTPDHLTAGHARRTAQQYNKGRNVPVYYHLDNPAVSVLEPGAYFSSYFLVVGGLVVILGAGAFMARSLLRT
jgi:hypothetical protein